MESKLLSREEVEEWELLPLCEQNRNIVVDRTAYLDRIVFRVGALTLIERAP